MYEDIRLESVLNFRDVGAFINRALGRNLLKEGILFRSAELNNASSADSVKLRDSYGIKTLLDLENRRAEIISRTIDPNGASPVVPFVNLPSNRVLGVTYHNHNICGTELAAAVVRNMNFMESAKVNFHAFTGNQAQLRNIFKQPYRRAVGMHGVVGQAIFTLEECGANFGQAIQRLADPANYPLIVYTKYGKEHTSLFILLVLLLLEVPVEAIQADYARSEKELDSVRAEGIAAVVKGGLDENFWSWPADWTASIRRYLVEKKGGLVQYLVGVGVDDGTQVRIRESLLCGVAEKLISF